MRLNSELVGPRRCDAADGDSCQRPWLRRTRAVVQIQPLPEHMCNYKIYLKVLQSPHLGQEVELRKYKSIRHCQLFCMQKGAMRSTSVWLAESIQHRRCKLLCQRCISPPRHHATIARCIEFGGIGIKASSKCCYVVILAVYCKDRGSRAARINQNSRQRRECTEAGDELVYYGSMVAI